MDDLPLSALPSGDPRNRLSTEARQRVLRAHLESERIQLEAEADVEARRLSGVKARSAITKADVKAARFALKVLSKEYSDAGLTHQEYWAAMKEEIEGAANSLELTGIQRRLLESEFFVPPEKKTAHPPTRPALPQPSKTADTVAAQIDRLRKECQLTVDKLAELIEIDVRSVRRHLKGDSVPYDRHLWAYERLFSKLLNRQVVISKLS